MECSTPVENAAPAAEESPAEHLFRKYTKRQLAAQVAEMKARAANTLSSRDLGALDATHFVIPAARGIQAGREYYTAMVRFKTLVEMSGASDHDLPLDLRAQRSLNRARVPVIADYIVKNPKDYAFSSITASVIDMGAEFVPSESSGNGYYVGMLAIPKTARVLVLDGQHRRAGIAEALRRNPKLGNESISVVFAMDPQLKRCQQTFADLNRHGVRPTKSISIAYDHRDPFGQMVLRVVQAVCVFKYATDLEKTSLAPKSPNLFTLAGIYQATQDLLGKKGKGKIATRTEEDLACAYWSEVAAHIAGWQQLASEEAFAPELRTEFVHAHGVALTALGILGRALIAARPDTWREDLARLEEIDWSRANPQWEGRALVNGRVSKGSMNIALTANLLKAVCGLPLTDQEQEYESRFQTQPGPMDPEPAVAAEVA